MKFIALLFTFFVLYPAMSQNYMGVDLKKLKTMEKGASCAPATTSTLMNLNNVGALMHTAGNLWQVAGQNFSQYEVPKNSGIMALFTSALWLGGTDVNGQLKMAALRYRQGQDYWTGPLTNISANIDASECLKYDNHYITVQDEIREFVSWYDAGILDGQNGTQTQSELFPNYKIPEIVKKWPAHGDQTMGQDYYLAPFFDRDNDGNYDWDKGDYPWHDITKTKECKVDRAVSLYGDINYWWVMNDKGNIHSETNSEPIGMEIRAQAFSFTSNDEINNMTFYNYELINRGTQTLFNTYFGFFTDGALGDPFDDYVGCDVNRGLGYYYNGDALDANNAGFFGYGTNPPAVGVDFFEGPYQDDDGIDNAYGIGPNEALNGIGYGDGIIDNERYGMRRFVYYSNTTLGANPNQTDPINPGDYYNYLRGRWKDGSPCYYGGSGHLSDPTTDVSTPAAFMFPGDTDPLGWGTNGVPQVPWTEQTAGNMPNDRRFLQSAGPFVLTPGAVNNITVGVCWARAAGGDPFASVEVLRRADDKAQALFEKCFKVLDGPNAPNVVLQELENEIILALYNPVNSNNYKDSYQEFDPFIIAQDSTADKFYRFQGYQIFQLRDENVSASELDDPVLARQVAQCDIKDEVDRIINFEFDEELSASIPVEKVNGSNNGIRHSFNIVNDLFAQGNSRLVNFKRYYYMVVSYAYNNYSNYDPNDPQQLEGQKKKYIQSRKASIGEIKLIEAIPHNPYIESGGIISTLGYGEGPNITRLDGIGNNFTFLELLDQNYAEILANGYQNELTYQAMQSPIEVKVIDPINISGGYYECKFKASSNIDTAAWVIYQYDAKNGNLLDSITSDLTISVDNEQLIPEWGISVRINQTKNTKVVSPLIYNYFVEPIGSSLTYSDSSNIWLDFIKDNDIFYPTNWIRSGTFNPLIAEDDPTLGIFNPYCYRDRLNRDPDKKYPKLLSGGIAPFTLVGKECGYLPFGVNSFYKASSATISQNTATLTRINGIDLVLTSDKSKWTKAAVIETGDDPALTIGNAEKMTLRKSPSVNKNGQSLNDGTTGLGWFPGYAVDVNTGRRLHIAFGENSFLSQDNGADMLWNPTSRIADNNGAPIFGGLHAVYIFGEDIDGNGCPFYQENNPWVYNKLQTETATSYRECFSNLMWVMNPLLKSGKNLLSSDVHIKVRINKEYQTYTASGSNNGLPHYGWDMSDYVTVKDQKNILASELDNIRVVPNPYNGRSEYERNKIDNRVKITNLPELCTIKIYSVSGKLIKTYKKDAPVTYQDWLLTNEEGISVASGTYLIVVDVPGVGTKIVKSFIAMRQVDLSDF